MRISSLAAPQILFGLGCGLFLSLGAPAQECDSIGPDLLVGDTLGIANYSSMNGIEAFSVGHYICNIGDQPSDMIATNNRHPVYGRTLYKLTLEHADGSTRIEQIGMSWLFHGLIALSQTFCCTDCIPHDGVAIGIHCTDTNSASSVGGQGGLGPRWQLNPYTGVFTYPPANPPWSGSVARRLQAHISDLEPSTQTVQYFVEATVTTQDDAAAGNAANNASYRPVSMVGSDTTWNMAYAGDVVRGRPGIYAWSVAHAGVTMNEAGFLSDGTFIVASRANAVFGRPGVWHYEYAVYNQNSARCARAFQVPLQSGVNTENPGFHDVDYHDGDGPNNINFDGTDWAFSDIGAARWQTQRESQNLWANALRWGTMYNFRFDAPAPPVNGAVSLEAYAGAEASLSVGTIEIPGFRTGDTNGDGSISLDDLARILSSFGLCQGEAGYDLDTDFDRDNCITLNDLGMLLSKFGE